MPDFALNGSSTLTRNLAGSESGFIGRNGSLIVTGSDAVTSSAGTNWITVLGQVYAQGGGFAAFDLGGSVIDMSVGADAYISAENPTGGTLDVDLTSTFNLQNAGTIHSNNSRAVNVSETDGSLTTDIRNTGTISAFTGEAVYVSAGTASIGFANTGTVTSDGQAVELTTNGAGSNIDFLNSGTIMGITGVGISISGVSGSLGTIINSGTIQGDDVAVSVGNAMRVAFANSGTIISESDAINLSSANDVITNTGIIQGDIIMGDGNDTLDTRGGTFNDRVVGGDGGDIYYIGTNDVLIIEGLDGGLDTVYSAASHTLDNHVERLYLTDQGEAINGTGNALNNFIVGNNSDNNLDGLAGDDFMVGGQGEDTLKGGIGDDILFGGADGDVLSGGQGIDTLAYSASQGWVNVSLLTGFVGGGVGSEAIGDTFTSMENLSGSAYGDLLSGDNGANILNGDAGDDNLRGRGGGDNLIGGSGLDTADYADSAAWVNVSLLTGFAGGGLGTHALGDTYTSIENLRGSQYADRLNGGISNNVLEGRQGADIIDGNGGTDTLSYASSGSFVNVSLLTGFAGGGGGNHAAGDTWTEMENLRGSAFDDLLNGDNNNNVLEGLAGDDQLRGNNGVDTFVFVDNFGDDTVLDFQNGSELFDFTGHTTANAFSDLSISTTGADAVIADILGNTITVTGGAGLIDATDFIF
ncbi:calcium-binding protein [uncultured Sulfitobacter sp.]|uniref:beta strand repeat-containing protein n=1 Tax=uncultured Sulfitobacter sp. TaxID=191468 RepID=UPI0026076FA3|nr:calcium-binding protein [uncultured Sulfitobacter sp.]